MKYFENSFLFEVPPQNSDVKYLVPEIAYLEYMTSSSRSEAWPEERPSSSTGMAVCILGPEEWNEPSLTDISDSRSAESQSVVSGDKVKFRESRSLLAFRGCCCCSCAIGASTLGGPALDWPRNYLDLSRKFFYKTSLNKGPLGCCFLYNLAVAFWSKSALFIHS